MLVSIVLFCSQSLCLCSHNPHSAHACKYYIHHAARNNLLCQPLSACMEGFFSFFLNSLMNSSNQRKQLLWCNTIANNFVTQNFCEQYADVFSIMLTLCFGLLLCSKLCQHNPSRPTLRAKTLSRYRTIQHWVKSVVVTTQECPTPTNFFSFQE